MTAQIRLMCLGLTLITAGCSAGTPVDDDGAVGEDSISEGDTVRHGYVVPGRCEIGQDVGEGCTCDELWPDGPRFCAGFEPAPTPCFDGNNDICCTDEDCDQGKCRLVRELVSCCGDDACDQNSSCGWPPAGGGSHGWCVPNDPQLENAINHCVVDECASDADCPTGFCDTLGATRECIEGTCKTNADCTMRAGGVCEQIALGCCGGLGSAARKAQTTCVYPDDGCTSDGECPTGSYCGIRDGFAACRRGECEGD